MLRRAGFVAGAVLGVLVALYAVDLLVSQGDVPRGVTVAGVEVGGLSRADAEERLRSEIEPRLVKPVPVRAGDLNAAVDPVRAGLSLNWASTLDQAGAQPVNPFTRLASFFTSREVGVVTQADRAQLINTLENLRSRIDREPAEGTIRFEGATPVPVTPKQGQQLQVQDAANAVLAGWASGQPVTLPVRETPVRVSAEAVQTALTQLAQPAVSGPVVIRGDGANATVPPEAIAAALRFEAGENGALAMKVDNTKIVESAGPQLKSTEKQGKDAQIVFSGGRPAVDPSVDGRGVDWNPTLEPLPDLLKRTGQRELVAKYVDAPAKVTTDQANRLGISEVIGEFTTTGFASDSGVNIRTVAAEVDGAIVKPGETFSLNGFTGPRGKPQGYVEAGVIENGAPAREVGGGISQFATTLYNASYFAGMKDAGHREHSYYISRYPAAREATVFQNPDGSSVIDLKFTNDADTGVAIQTIWTPSSITVKLWGTKRYNVESVPGERTDFVDPTPKPGPPENCHPSNGAPGFTTSDTRVLRDLSGRVVRSDKRTVHYNPQPKIMCGG
ncbi:vanomycin resistance protein VanB [Amycolatopsis alkalitolerans]|uniref:Vanomycin resistance protein VanB n=2 Tax=Amycolatopsis alkalitolerans TaxID=2547244 RepID=A0A5C4LY80_9PSEU|nr:vanomycin resistance protein VanB [Amycolatopsis alkalitolerans]